MIRVKICGLTRPEDVRRAVSLGAAYVGFNFSAHSPRRIDPGKAGALAGAAGRSVRRVGVFVEEDPAFVRGCIAAGSLDMLQFHRPIAEGDFQYGLPVIAVCSVSREAPVRPQPALLGRCHALLFDTSEAGRGGGTGKAFDWRLVGPGEEEVPRWLAGGLDAGNVEEAIRRARPAVVDVASGVEIAPGVKDGEKMRRFFEAVARAGGDA